MRILPLACLWILALNSLSSAQTEVSAPKGAPRLIFGDLRRETDPGFTQAEKALIATARRNVEQQDKSPVDGYYKVTSTPKGFEVYILYVTWDGNHPISKPGGFCSVSLDKTGHFIRINPGA